MTKQTTELSKLSDEELSDRLTSWLTIVKTNDRATMDTMIVIEEYKRRHTRPKITRNK